MSNAAEQFPDQGTQLSYDTLAARTLALRSQTADTSPEIAASTAQAWIDANKALSKRLPKAAAEDAAHAALAAAPESNFKKLAIYTLRLRINHLPDSMRMAFISNSIRILSDRMTCELAPTDMPVLSVLKDLAQPKIRQAEKKAEAVPA